MIKKNKSLLTKAKEVFSSSYFKAVVGRYILYLFIAAEVFALPLLIDNETYSDFEYVKNLVFLSPFLLLGIPSGYLYIKYNYKYENVESILISGVLYSIIFALVIWLFFTSITVAIAVFIIMLYTCFEPIIKVNKRYILAFSFKPILSIFVLLVAFLLSTFLIEGQYQSDLLLLFPLILAFGFWLFFSRKTIKFSSILTSIKLDQFTSAIKKGFPISIGTALISILFFSDRYFIEKYCSEALDTYSFGFNISQVVIMALTTISYVSVVEIGENKQNLNKDDLRKSFYFTVAIFIGLFIAIMVLVNLIIIPIYTDFSNLNNMLIYLICGKGFFFSAGVIMPVVLYYNYHTRLAILLGLIVTLVLCINYNIAYFFKLEYYYILLTSNLGLIFYTLYSLYIIFYKIDYAKG